MLDAEPATVASRLIMADCMRWALRENMSRMLTTRPRPISCITSLRSVRMRNSECGLRNQEVLRYNPAHEH